MKNIFERNQEWKVAQDRHLMEILRVEPIEDTAVRADPLVNEIRIPWQERDRNSATISLYQRVSIPAQDQSDLHHLAQFEPIHPIVRFVEKIGKEIVLWLPSRIIRRVTKFRPRQFRHVFRKHRSCCNDSRRV